MILNRHVLAVFRAADDSTGETYNHNERRSIHFGSGYVEATDGVIYLRAPIPPQGKLEHYPAGWKEPLGSLLGKSISLPGVKKLLTLFKKYDGNFAIAPDGTVSWGRENREKIVLEIPRSFPDTSNVLPKVAPIVKVRLNTAYLEELVRVAKLQSDEERGNGKVSSITFSIYDENRAVGVKISGHGKIDGTLMPMSPERDDNG